ncbi:reverse transcriptase domain-containing protein, partial [Tanacetum coccineum]
GLKCNGIIGRPGIKKIQVVPSTAHGMLKFLVERWVLTIRSSKIVTIECASIAGPIEQPPAINQAAKERIKVAINPEYLDQTIMIGSTLTKEGRNKLCDLLRCNLYIFAWKPVDMIGVSRHIAEHRLNVQEGCLPIRQNRRGQAADRNKAIQEEVGKLVDAGIMKEVHYHSWLSNPVMVESLFGFPFKCFLDAYKGYHQIKMAKEDEEKTAFITSQGIYYYSKMPFGLRNTGATYQRLVDKAFHKQVGRNLEVYVDDLVIKHRTEGEIIRVIEETFKKLREINMKLNPKKCTFRVEEGIFLGYKVNTKGIKVCPDKVDAVLSLPSPKCLKDVQKLNGKLASLNRPRISVKGLILADFIVERPEEDSVDTPMKIGEKLLKPWILFTDGSSCADGSCAGLILTSLEGIEFTYALRFGFETTNNEAEYETLIAGMRIAEQMGIKSLQANVDSQLVANQVNETYIAKEADMIRYLEKVKTLTNGFQMFTIKQVLRSENKKADALSKIASTSFAHLNKQVLVEELKEKSINEAEVLVIVEEEGETWMTLIHDYITGGILPAEVDRARAVKRKSQRYFVVNGILYKKYFLGPWLRCVGPLQANYVLREIHEGSCSMHRFASVKHPQTNGLVERANRSLGEGIKARLKARSKNWMEEIFHVLWAHRTMIKSSNRDTPFSLTYGTEAVIPAEIGMPTLRTTKVDVVRNNEALEVNLDSLEERREQAAIHEAKSKRKMEKYYNVKVRSTTFKPEDLVYRNNDASHAEQGGKLGPKWEGPYEVTEALGKGAYKLRGHDGKQLPRTWNIRNLKKCYVNRT